MTTHISARVAWHNDGWNGRICKNPAANTFCVGSHSYPGNYIFKRRCLEWENSNAGTKCNDLERIPPCSFSINMFGDEEVTAEADPPDFFNDNTEKRQWILPPATVSIWPYEAMYTGDVIKGRTFDYDRRLERAREYFNAIEPNRSLIFYYSNYSNPFSEDEAKRYVLIGVSRIKSLGEELFYEGCSQKVRERYGGGFVWQRSITSHYPDQGFRIPYHHYKDNPEVLEQIALFPDNPRLCKYATRHMSDDDALGLLESFLRVIYTLKDMGDTTEDWQRRAQWVENLIAELWRHRGLFPGMGAVLTLLRMPNAIPYFKDQALKGNEIEAHHALFDYLEDKENRIENFQVSTTE